MNKYEKALRLFTGYDQYREWTQEPHAQEEYVYASEAHVAIQIEKRLLEYDYPELEKPNFASVFQVKKDLDMVMTLKGMSAVYDSIPYTTMERCEACGGKGVVDYEFEYDCTTYTQSGECPVCGGEGVVESHVRKRDFRYSVILLDSYEAMKQKYFGILISAMKTLEIDSIRLVGWNGCAFIFEACDGVRIVISAYIEDKWKEHVVKFKEEQNEKEFQGYI